VCGVLCVVALALNIYRLGVPSIWFDEAFSVELARQPLPLLWHIIFGPEPNMELYYLLLHFWLQLTGAVGLLPVEWVVRLPSALCAALSTGVVFWLGRRYLGRGAGCIAALLYALNYLQLIYAQQTRAYALQLLLLCLSWFALLAACAPDTLSGPRKRWWGLYVLSMTLAVYAHYFSVLVLLAQVLALLGLWLLPGRWQRQTRKQLFPWLGSLVAIGLLIIPMLIESQQGAKTGWLPVPHLRELWSLFQAISGDNIRYLLVVGCAGLVGLVLASVGWLLRRNKDISQQKRTASEHTPWSRVRVGVMDAADYVPLAWALLCWFVVPVVVSYVVSQGSLRLFSTRYLVVVVPALCLLAALGVAALRWLPGRVLLSLLLLGSAVLVTPHYYQNAQVEDWQAAVHWLQARYQTGDGLVCYDNEMNQGCQIAIEYYLHAYPGGAHFTTDTPGLFSWDKFGPANEQSGFLAALDPHALTDFASHHSHVFMILGRIPDANGATHAQQTVQWLNQHYHLSAQLHTATVTVLLYATGV
jgi:4-amino-4-deoxy-L-arabinose transferase-like glycosyltransferase